MRDLVETTIESATLRVRPLLMTVGMNIVGLIPVMIWRGFQLRRERASAPELA